MTCPEYSVVKAHIADINRRIPATDVSSYAYDLFQADLICEAGHDSAITITGIAPQGKVASSLAGPDGFRLQETVWSQPRE